MKKKCSLVAVLVLCFGTINVLFTGFSFSEDMFKESPSMSIQLKYSSLGLDIGDMNGDGLTDIVCSEYSSKQPEEATHIYIFYQKPDHTFAKSYSEADVCIDTGVRIRGGVVIGNLDGDNLLDVIIKAGTYTHFYFLQAENFSSPHTANVCWNGGWSSVIGDINDDGREDIIYGYELMHTRGILNCRNTPEKSYVYRSVIGDVNGDGKSDLVSMTGSPDFGKKPVEPRWDGTNIYYSPVRCINKWPGLRPDVRIDYDANLAVIGDLNSDGRKDIALGNKNGKELGIFFQGKNTPFVEGVSSPDYRIKFAQLKEFALGDLNCDDKDDIIASGKNEDNNYLMWMFYQNPSGGFSATSTDDANLTLQMKDEIRFINVADLNGDGSNDVVLYNAKQKTILIFLGRRRLL